MSMVGLLPYVRKNRRKRRADRAPDVVTATPEHQLQRAKALGHELVLVRTGKRVAWDTRHSIAACDLTAAVDMLAIYRATGVITARHERAGRLYLAGRHATFGGVYPRGTTLSRLIALGLPQSLEQAQDWGGGTLDTDEQEARQERIEAAYRAADRHLLRTAGAGVRRVLRIVLVDGDKAPPRQEYAVRLGLECLARHWKMQDDDAVVRK